MIELVLGVILWSFGKMLMEFGEQSKKVIEYWADREADRINREYGDNCESRKGAADDSVS